MVADEGHAGGLHDSPVRMHMRNRFAQHIGTMHARSTRMRPHSEQGTDIAKPRSGQQCVNERMHDDITIRVAIESGALVIPSQTGQPHVASANGKTMGVESLPDSKRHFFDFFSASSRAMVSLAASSGALV